MSPRAERRDEQVEGLIFENEIHHDYQRDEDDFTIEDYAKKEFDKMVR